MLILKTISRRQKHAKLHSMQRVNTRETVEIKCEQAGTFFSMVQITDRVLCFYWTFSTIQRLKETS